MKIYSLSTRQKLNIDLDKAWEFFSTPKNLQEITPNDLSFNIISELPETMYPGLIIEYIIQPFPLVKFNWVTEITHVSERKYFVDEQRFGPYKFWHHKHFFTESEDGIIMDDIIHWGLPFGLLGRTFGAGLVKNQLDKIFNYRYKALDKYFNHK